MLRQLTLAASAAALLAGTAAAAQQAAPAFGDLALPSAEVTPQEAYVRAVARLAYVWGWPMVNMLNRRTSITQAPSVALLDGILPVAPCGQIAMLNDYINPDQRAVACPNQDVVYGLGFFDLDAEPAVIQVPDFGDRFWVYAAYDQRTDQFGQLGKPYGTAPGFYLLVGPNWNGEVPEGITAVVRSPTSLANIIPRIFMSDSNEERAAIQPLVNQIVAYPLAEFSGEPKTYVWADIPVVESPGGGSGDGTETRWVVPETFFDQFAQVLDMVPPQPGEEALYAQFRWLMDIAAKDPGLKAAIVDEAAKAEAEVIDPFIQWKHNGRPVGNGWNRSMNNAAFGADYFNRTATARSNIFENRTSETQYFYTDDDASGAALDGTRTYAITFAAGQEPPVDGFWSLTLYNEHHFFHANDLGRYSLGTKNTTLQRNADGSLTLYAGAASPGADRETNWLPAPEGPFSLYIRAYWGKEAILDGSWTPPTIEVAQ
ncbi:MAG: hypothetical protein DI556_19180 [Rhodovulum sulfidophilum]|uniref:DUF1254 domain-containing protein n=1 Tax=Rhodovulum sulfidophilum TaxID=35806 RepID=A0A2W5N0I0_RHOSU|nr:MAG: hypothetical protein DI556_19180 [Rhodovulum sulfidophilum]